jgi:hypothetical protein
MDGDLYVGCVSETDVHCFESGKNLSDVKYALDVFMVREDTHLAGRAGIFAQHNSNVMPVLDERKRSWAIIPRTSCNILMMHHFFMNQW